MLGFPIGLIYANVGEWVIHKYWLHGLGRKKDSLWAFHWYEHHRASRKHDGLDPHYARKLTDGLNPQSSEAIGLAVAAVVHAPLFPIAPWFTTGVLFSLANYYRVHRRSHEEPGYMREHLPWHYDHHMGPNQHANWCVTYPWTDWVMGTRIPYAGTAKEADDLARKAARSARADTAVRTEPAGEDVQRAA